MRRFLIAILVFFAATALVTAIFMRDSSTMSPLKMAFGNGFFPEPLKCDLSNYKSSTGLTAAVDQNTLVVTWAGEADGELRARYAIEAATPVIRDLAIRKPGAQWITLGSDLTPEYEVISGRRRVSNQQLQRPRERGLEITKEFMDREAWYAFWDAPLVVPGIQPGGAPQNPDLPRKAEEIRRAKSKFNTTSCDVRTDGGRMEVNFPGLSMGIFAGSLRFTVYRGTNLIRLEAIAKTDENFVAYKYNAALKGFATDILPHVTWRDTGGNTQQYRFGGPHNDDPVAIRAKNRVLIAEGRSGSVAVFPPPTVFFWKREIDTNLGYVWYRKDADARYAIGVKQADHEDDPRYLGNYALYNAPPGTWQRMAVYFYASPDAAQPARDKVMAFTHGDTFPPFPGYKTLVEDFHLGFVDRQRASGSVDTELPDFAAMKAIGINIVGISEFHGDKLRNDSGPGRFADQKAEFEALRRAGDTDFVALPWELSMNSLGSDWDVVTPHPVYWSQVRDPGQPFTENDPRYGKVYHIGSAEDVLRFVTEEHALWITGHPRTKTSTGYPDAFKDTPFARSDQYLGLTFQPGMGMDLSQSRLCEYRCFDAMDMLNNLYADSGLQPKYLVAGPDTYQKWPHDDLYPGFQVSYVKLDRLPGPDQDWSSILTPLRRGDFFETTGEILIKNYTVTGSGNQRTVGADVEWTFPLEFVEVVWGDGKKVDRQIIRATDLAPFGNKRFSIPFDATGKKWVRFAVWDSAGNGGFVQPVWLNAPTNVSGLR
jgi:hypothetical protein